MNTITSKLTELATEKLMSDLCRFGNDPSDDAWVALSKVCACYTGIAFGQVSGRYAFPLPTGLGKTRSIVAWLFAVDKLGLKDISVIITASKVEALCCIKRDLLESGVPENKIGLVHSYDFDPVMAEAYIKGEREELASDYASEPSTEDYETRPFLLLTHQMIKGKKGISRFNVFNSKPRSLVVWDESLLASEAFAFQDDRILSDIGAIAPLHNGWSPERDEAIAYLRDAHEVIVKEIVKRKADPERIERIFKLTPLSGEQIVIYKKALGSSDHAVRLRKLLDISLEDLRVLANVKQKGGIVTFRVSVPRELQNIVVLDASYPIRELIQLDQSIRQTDIKWDIVNYENVTIHQLDHSSGRTAMEKGFSEKRGYNQLSREVAEVIKGIPANEAVLLFTFKKRDNIDFRKLLLRDLRDNGIDTQATVEVNGVLKPRINTLTWGCETSLNQFSYCSNVILVGSFYKPHLDIGGAMIGQIGNILQSVTSRQIDKVVESEVAHTVYQAISRGSCRVMQGQRTRPMKAWLIHPEYKDLKSRIQKVMPGVEWTIWEPKFLPTQKTNRKAEPLALTIREHLATLCDKGIEKVSIKQLKDDLRLKDAAPSSVQRAIKKAVDSTGGTWGLHGRTVWQESAWLFGEAQTRQARSADQLSLG